ncbi:MAG: hypothetical protein IPJ74_22125 [Saprospiraceae bacterium]|nr:hypothetical protein [Saprospiraceae bacterium]
MIYAITFIIFIILLGAPSLLVVIDFLKFLFTGERLYKAKFIRALEIITVGIFPIFYLTTIERTNNTCCGDSATFSPDHKLTIYVLILLCIANYFYSTFRTTIKSPILEVFINSILLIGLTLNIFVAIQIYIPVWLLGNLPITIFFIYQLINNQKLFIKENELNAHNTENALEKLAWKLLKLRPIIKFPILLVICLPILTIIICLLMLFGQKPDAIIRAFTDTYKHGFSQLDHLCDNVTCGGHFLCSVAANGHKEIVHPIRNGERNGGKIICNRQLLIANAFEELIAERVPKFHKIIRRNYNKVGNLIHLYYYVFNKKIISDIVYILMKPLEIGFLIIIYTLDRKPENRIMQQYLSKFDRQKLNEQIKLL